MLNLSATAALWFMLPVTLVSFLAAFNDLKNMRLPNALVIGLALIYIILGPFLLPLQQYLWGFLNGVVMYVVGMFAFALLGVGAGDGKFAAAMAMFIPTADAWAVGALFSSFLLGAFAAHRLLRAIPSVRRASPDWVSWQAAKFPMGLALAGTMVSYLGFAIFL